MNTIQYSPKEVHYMQHVFIGPTRSSTQTASQSLQPFLQALLGDRPTDRPTDHATRSVTIGGAHSGEVKLCYCHGYNKYLLEHSTEIHHACLSFVSVHQMAPPVTEVTAPYYSFMDPEGMKG